MTDSDTIASAPRNYQSLSAYTDAGLYQILLELQVPLPAKELFDWQNANHEMRTRRVVTLLKAHDLAKWDKPTQPASPVALRTQRTRAGVRL